MATQRMVGVDPGGRETGIVLCDGPEVLRAAVITRTTGGKLPDSGYLLEVTNCIWEYLDDGDAQVAVEGLVHPTWHAGAGGKGGLANVTGLLATAVCLGAVLLAFPEAIVVRPAKHGSGPINSYPEILRPKRGKGAGSDRLRHCRSAADIATSARLGRAVRASRRIDTDE